MALFADAPPVTIILSIVSILIQTQSNKGVFLGKNSIYSLGNYLLVVIEIIEHTISLTSI